MKTRHWALATSLCLALGATAPAAAPSSPSAPEKVLRYAIVSAETGMDPPQLSDLYSRVLTSNVFEALYGYDYLARPAKVKPVLADGMPQVSDDYKTYTIRLKRGVHFAPDPVFGGKKREVTAHDIVFSYKRFFDPATKSPSLSALAEEKILGTAEARKKAEARGKFDYDSEIEGVQALDRYTVQFRLAQSRPRFILSLADPGIFGTVAREVVERYGDRIMEHPVGTGAFMVSEWKRSSKITFVPNPNFRADFFEAEPAADDPSAQALYQQLKGKRLPLVDKVVVSVIEEPQPRWLAFLNNEHELMERLPQSFATHAVPNDKLAPNLAKRGIQMERVALSDITMLYFRMTDPVVGGYTPAKVALRRALALAYNTEEEIRLPRRGQAIVAQGFVMPNTGSFDPLFRSEMGTFDRARAIALLDMFGYVDKDGDGWRDLPDGSPLVLEHNTLSTADYRELDEILKKSMNAINVRITFKVGKWPEQLKASRAGKLQMWGYGLSASSPNSAGSLELGYSKSFGQQNHSRFSNARFDALFEQQSAMPDGPERDAVIQDAVRVLVAYMPLKVRVHRLGTDLTQPWMSGYKRHPFAREFWKYIDIDTTRLPK